MRNFDGSDLYDARNGKLFCYHQNKSLIALDAPFQNENALDYMKVGGRGIVILTIGKKKSAIYYDGKRARRYFYEGKLYPIYKKIGCCDGHRPAVDGFILECGKNMILLSADCRCKGMISCSDPRQKL